MKETHKQLPLGQYQSMLNPLVVVFKKWVCLLQEWNFAHFKKNVLDFKGVLMDIPTLIDFTVRGLPARESIRKEINKQDF